MNCEDCGSSDTMVFAGEYYPEDDYQEPDMLECMDCGHAEML